MEIEIENGLRLKLNKDYSATVISSSITSGTISIPPFVEHESVIYATTTIERSLFDNNEIENVLLPSEPNNDDLGILMNQIRQLERQLCKYKFVEPFDFKTVKKIQIKGNIIDQMKELQKLLLNYIENENDEDDNFHDLIEYINAQNIIENQKKFKEFLHLISNVSMHHQRCHNFINKIQKILIEYKLEIKQTFSIQALFELFNNNRIILLFLFEKKIIPTGKYILEYMLKTSDSNGSKYCHFFYPEIKLFLDEYEQYEIENEIRSIDPSALTDFKEKREIGENNSHLCKLIRDDSIDEFIIYVNRYDVDLSKTVSQSIFETNAFLLKKDPTLVEYAAFFGSIQIFNYLRLNSVELKPSLWFYVIHSQNAELIHLLEEIGIEPEDKSFDECLKESIKCHHNSIANYIENCLLDGKIEAERIKNNFNKNVVSYGFHYFNYQYFPKDFQNQFIFYYACKYDHLLFVEFLLDTQDIDINKVIVF